MVGAGGQFIFAPDRLVIQPGETVSFVVASSGHTATAYHPDNRGSSPVRIPDGAAAWDSGILSAAGASWDYTFDIEGAYNYYCLPHEGAGMVGMIVVGAASDGPGMQPLQDTIPLAARNKLQELIDWADSL
jgi:plastocyanin